MKYIGSKTKLLDFIDQALKSSGIEKIESFADIFAGTGSVAAHVAKKYGPRRILLNDLQYYSYVLCRAKFQGPKHGGPLPAGTVDPKDGGFFYEHYADMYFTKDNARRIDGWLAAIQPDDFYAKACLLDAVTKVSNTACVYENYLKDMSRRALSALVVRPVEYFVFPGKIEYHNQRAEDLVPDQVYDVVYVDPPYNGRKYATNYHILETIARNDRPELRCKAKIRADATLSAFNSRRKVREVLGLVLDTWKSKCRHLCMSYNSEGILSKEDIVTMLKQRGYGDVGVYEKEYPRFSTHASDTTKTVFEYVFVASGLKSL